MWSHARSNIGQKEEFRVADGDGFALNGRETVAVFVMVQVCAARNHTSNAQLSHDS